MLTLSSFLGFCFLSPRHSCWSRPAHKKETKPCPKGRPQTAGTLPKSHPRRNATLGRNGRIFGSLFRPADGSGRPLEMAVGQVLKLHVPALRVEKPHPPRP